MGTPSLIGYEVEPGIVRYCYCHWDGHLISNGKTLREHYKTEDQVRELVGKGDMSTLGSRCDAPEGHSYNTPVADCTVYYGRDRGETGVAARNQTIGMHFAHPGTPYVYLFKDGKWFVSTVNLPGLQELTEEMTSRDLTPGLARP